MRDGIYLVLTKTFESFSTDEVAHLLTNLGCFRLRQVCSSGIEEAGNAKARTVELTKHERERVVLNWHEVCGPQKRQLRHCQTDLVHDLRHGSLQSLPQLLPLRRIWREDGLLVITADTLWVLVMFNPDQVCANAHESGLSVIDAGEEPLVNHQTSCFH